MEDPINSFNKALDRCLVPDKMAKQLQLFFIHNSTTRLIINSWEKYDKENCWNKIYE